MRPKHKRLAFIMVALLVMAGAATLLLRSFQENLIYFYTPTLLQEKLAAGTLDRARSLRIGGLVKPGSVENDATHSRIRFLVTDGAAEYPVEYQGLIPTLFREGQGVVALGHLTDGQIVAKEILAKHDENYMPPDVAKAIKKTGHWQEKTGTPTTEPVRP